MTKLWPGAQDRCSTRFSSTWMDPPPAPVADNADAFVEWTAGHLAPPSTGLQCLSGRNGQGDQGAGEGRRRQGAGEQLPFLVILPIKSRLAYRRGRVAAAREGAQNAREIWPPSARRTSPSSCRLGNNQIGFFTVYDGSFDTYIADFTKNIGPVFDLIFKFTKDPPPSPCRKHLQEFIDFAAGANRDPDRVLQAYPGLSGPGHSRPDRRQQGRRSAGRSGANGDDRAVRHARGRAILGRLFAARDRAEDRQSRRKAPLEPRTTSRASFSVATGCRWCGISC